MTTPYAEETLHPDRDDGTMVESLNELRQAVIGHRIISAEQKPGKSMGLFGTEPQKSLILTLDNGKQVAMHPTNDCCAYTEVESFLLDPASVDHVITGVGTTKGFTTWHIYADYGDICKVSVGWSPGNPFYYGYGFHIRVKDVAS